MKTDNEYFYIHQYLIKTYGNADHCANPECESTSPKRFEWALLKGRRYSKEISDYIPLCPSCHRK